MGNAASDLAKVGDALDPTKNGVGAAVVDAGKAAANIGATAVNTALSPVKAVGGVVGINVPVIPTMSGGVLANTTQAIGNLSMVVNPVNVLGGALPGLASKLPGVINGVAGIASNPMGLVAGAMGGIGAGLGMSQPPAVAPGGAPTAGDTQQQNDTQQNQNNLQQNLPLAGSGQNSSVFGGATTGMGSVGQPGTVNSGLGNGATTGVLNPTVPLGSGADPAATAAALQAQQGAQMLQVAIIGGGALALILLLKKPPSK